LELGSALRACRGAFLGIGLITGMINVLYLTGSFFMLEVYDRVIPSRSMPTLVGLGILAGALYLFQGCLDLIRGRLLVRIGAFIDEAISGRAFDAVVRLPLISRGGGMACNPFATWIRSGASCLAWARQLCSIYLGCRSIWASASRSTSGLASQR
jgi:ABC-type protease/lipase transport system fused ATPase/permease subunit